MSSHKSVATSYLQAHEEIHTKVLVKDEDVLAENVQE